MTAPRHDPTDEPPNHRHHHHYYWIDNRLYTKDNAQINLLGVAVVVVDGSGW